MVGCFGWEGYLVGSLAPQVACLYPPRRCSVPAIPRCTRKSGSGEGARSSPSISQCVETQTWCEAILGGEALPSCHLLSGPSATGGSPPSGGGGLAALGRNMEYFFWGGGVMFDFCQNDMVCVYFFATEGRNEMFGPLNISLGKN